MLVVAAAIVACDSYSSDPDTDGSLSGTWTGSAEGTTNGDPFELAVTFTLTEYLGGLSGTFATEGGTTGGLNGTVSGANVSFTISQSSPCAGTFPGTASISMGGTRLTGTYSGVSGCTGQLTASFVVDRG